MRTIVSAALALTLLASCAPAEPGASSSVGARELQGRLFAPCCWNQTLDVHESELASSLRAEIRERLRAGEASTAIEDDLAARFGERIRAVPRGRDPRSTIPTVVAIGMAVAVLALLAAARRWRSIAVAREPEIAASCADDEYDHRLEDELRGLDDV